MARPRCCTKCVRSKPTTTSRKPPKRTVWYRRQKMARTWGLEKDGGTRVSCSALVVREKVPLRIANKSYHRPENYAHLQRLGPDNHAAPLCAHSPPACLPG